MIGGAARLDQFDKVEWRDVVRAIRPDWTDAQFEKAWKGFLAIKDRRRSH